MITFSNTFPYTIVPNLLAWIFVYFKHSSIFLQPTALWTDYEPKWNNFFFLFSSRYIGDLFNDAVCGTPCSGRVISELVTWRLCGRKG